VTSCGTAAAEDHIFPGSLSGLGLGVVRGEDRLPTSSHAPVGGPHCTTRRWVQETTIHGGAAWSRRRWKDRYLAAPSVGGQRIRELRSADKGQRILQI